MFHTIMPHHSLLQCSRLQMIIQRRGCSYSSFFGLQHLPKQLQLLLHGLLFLIHPQRKVHWFLQPHFCLAAFPEFTSPIMMEWSFCNVILGNCPSSKSLFRTWLRILYNWAVSTVFTLLITYLSFGMKNVFNVEPSLVLSSHAVCMKRRR